MNGRRGAVASLSLLVLALLGVPALAQDKLSLKALESKDAKEFFQTLKTDTTQKMTVQNMEVEQKQEQTFYFKWTPKGSEGSSLKVEEEIIGVKMSINIGGNKINYDSTDANQPKNPMTEFFTALQGTKFTLTIDTDKMEVTKVEGVKEMVEKLTKVNKSMEPLLKQILTEESVKQMATPVVGYLPPKGEIPKDKTWNNSYSLNLGPIGSYETKNKYTISEKDQKDKEKVKINVESELNYKAPTKEELTQSKLPFKILPEGTSLASKKGTGYILHDNDKGRLDSSELTVNLEGTLKVEVAGAPTDVRLEQSQTTTVTTSDTDPLKKKS